MYGFVMSMLFPFQRVFVLPALGVFVVGASL